MDLQVLYYDALIFLLLLNGPLTKDFLIQRVVGLGLNPQAEGFKTSLRTVRGSQALRASSWPLLKLSRYGEALARIVENFINDMGLRVGPTLPALELMAAILRLDGRIELNSIYNAWDFVGGMTAEEARAFHADKGKTVSDYDTWLELGIGSGCIFWFEGHLFFLELPKKVHNQLIKSCTLFKELKQKLGEAS